MANPMKLRDLIRMLEAHGCRLRFGKGDHIQIHYKGKNIGTLRAGHKDVGPGTVIALERRMGVDLDGINKRKQESRPAAPLPALSSKEGRDQGAPQATRTQGTHRATSNLAGPDAGSGNAPGDVERENAGLHRPAPNAPAEVSTPAQPLFDLADALDCLAAMIKADPMGVRLRHEKDEVIIEYTAIDQRGLHRRVAVGPTLKAAVQKARSR